MEARPPKRRKLQRPYDKQLQVALRVHCFVFRDTVLTSPILLQAQAGLVQQAQSLLAKEMPADSSPEPVAAPVVDEAPVDIEDGAWLDHLPNDTLAALQLLRAQFPAKLLTKVFQYTPNPWSSMDIMVAQ